MIKEGLSLKSFRFMMSAMYVFIFALVLGLILWSVQLRLMQVQFEGSSSYVLVLLSDVDENSKVVFQYPHVESPFYLGRVSNFVKDKGFLLQTQQGIHLPREMIVGSVLYEF